MVSIIAKLIHKCVISTHKGKNVRQLLQIKYSYEILFSLIYNDLIALGLAFDRDSEPESGAFVGFTFNPYLAFVAFNNLCRYV